MKSKRLQVTNHLLDYFTMKNFIRTAKQLRQKFPNSPKCHRFVLLQQSLIVHTDELYESRHKFKGPSNRLTLNTN